MFILYNFKEVHLRIDSLATLALPHSSEIGGAGGMGDNIPLYCINK